MSDRACYRCKNEWSNKCSQCSQCKDWSNYEQKIMGKNSCLKPPTDSWISVNNLKKQVEDRIEDKQGEGCFKNDDLEWLLTLLEQGE